MIESAPFIEAKIRLICPEKNTKNMLGFLLLGTCLASLREDYEDFLKMYEKEYESIEEHEYRFKVYGENMKRIAWHRQADPTAMYEINKFADLTHEEFAMYKGYRPNMEAPRQAMEAYPEADIPDSFDWRDKDVVTAVKNQGQCGSCWTFATTGAVESKWAIKTGKLVEFSEQQLIDCDKTDEGCNGGLPENAYKYIADAGGLETEQDYSYKGVEGTCSFAQGKAAAQIKGSIKIPADEVAMASALVKEGPLSIGLNAYYMQFYKGGISDPAHCSGQMDHGVLIVGYGVENSVPYWIIKNSWGPDWGEQGYYRIVRGKGMCGLMQDVTNPQID